MNYNIREEITWANASLFPALRDNVPNIMKGYLLRTPWGKEKLWPFHFSVHRAHNILGMCVCVCVHACSWDELHSYLFSVWPSQYYFWLHIDLSITRKLSNPCPSSERVTSQNTPPLISFFKSSPKGFMLIHLLYDTFLKAIKLGVKGVIFGHESEWQKWAQNEAISANIYWALNINVIQKNLRYAKGNKTKQKAPTSVLHLTKTS